DEDEPRHGEDVEEWLVGAGEATPELVDAPRVRPGQHHPREGPEEGRRYERGQDQPADQTPARYIGASRQPRERRAQRDRREPHPEREHNRVPEGFLERRIG